MFKRNIRTFSSTTYKNKHKMHQRPKLPEEIIGTTLFDINRSNVFLDLSPRVTELETKITKINLKAFVQQPPPSPFKSKKKQKTKKNTTPKTKQKDNLQTG